MIGQPLVQEFNDDEEILIAVAEIFIERGEDPTYETILQDASSRLQDDKDFVMKMARINGHNLEFATPRLNNDPQVILSGVESYEDAVVLYASDDLMRNEEFLSQVVQ